MGYVVEVPVTEDDFVGQMNRMRAWLDHRRVEPSSFTLAYAAGQKRIRVLFENEDEATAFTAEFGGTRHASSVSDVITASRAPSA